MKIAIRGIPLLVALTAVFSGASPADELSRKTESPRPVLVELFTSEGCSDCPPADVLLTNLVQRQPVPGTRIIALEEHISYWNNPVHWVDPFSSTQFTNRQYDYSSRFNDDSPYTPEMVIDGATHFVGSDSDQAARAISDAAEAPFADVSLQLSGTVTGSLNATVDVNNVPREAAGHRIAVLLAVTEDDLVSHVLGGENRGRVLPHSSVARSLDLLGYLTTSGFSSYSTTVSIEKEWTRHPLSAVVFLQDITSKRIYGADEKAL